MKFGYIRSNRRYRCKACGCQFADTKLRGVNPALQSSAIVLYAYYSVSIGNLARMVKVSTVAVLKWIRHASASIKMPAPEKTEIVMVDEFWHFVNGKNKV